ncbi:MAG: hypothetical protein AMXMBFR84_19420 [Candidatus Hydrogenedentota bacterium]
MVFLSNMNTRLRDMIERQLLPGEHIAWMGQPVPRFFTGRAVGAMVFGAAWIGFIAFFFYDVTRYFDSGLLSLLTGPFLAIGIGLMAGGPLWAYRDATHTHYVVTNQRVLIVNSAWGFSLTAFKPSELSQMRRRERRNGMGDIVIRYQEGYDDQGDFHAEEWGLMNLPNPREIEAILLELISKNAPRHAPGGPVTGGA